MSIHFKQQLAVLGYSDYRSYLASKHWSDFCQKTRAKQCYCCKRQYGLQVHHITYERLGNELPKDVRTVCRYCHCRIHAIVVFGTPLSEAHDVYRQHYYKWLNYKQQWRTAPERWGTLSNLLHKSRYKTLGTLLTFFNQKGLISGTQTTIKAYELKFVCWDEENGIELWDRNKYIKLIKADRKYKQCRNSYKKTTEKIRRQALID